MKTIARQIIRENPEGTISELALELYNSRLEGPSYTKCKQIISETKKQLKKGRVK
jgi:hypothetical protein